jgi:hypothetical protein
MFLFCSHGSSRRFKPPWTLVRDNAVWLVVRDAKGVSLAWLYCRDDGQRTSFGACKLSSDEARRIGKTIARRPELLMACRGFYPRTPALRLRDDRPPHMALEDRDIHVHWDGIDTLCKLNSPPFNATGEVVRSDSIWRGHEFARQMDAILFRDRFLGRWLRATEFHYPERLDNLPELKMRRPGRNRLSPVCDSRWCMTP